MIYLILAAIAGAFVILKATADAAHASLPGGASVGDIVKRINDTHRPKAEDLNLAAQALAAEGYHQTAEAIRDKADIAHVIERAPKELPSPLPGVSAKAWQAFVNLCKGKELGEVSPSYQFGLFNIGYRRLADLGLASGVRRGLYHQRSVWFGNFVSPLTLERFLSSPAIQYRVFCKDMADRHKLIATAHPNAIGEPLEGVTTSLSGLLAVAKLAGATGLSTWLTDAAERKKFSQTTAAFKAANGLF